MGEGLRALDIWYEAQVSHWFEALSWREWIARGRDERTARILAYASRRA